MKDKLKLFWHSNYLNFRHIRDKWLKPVAEVFVKFDISANQLTAFRFLLAFVIPVLIGWNYWMVVALMSLNLILDGVDGAIARITGKMSLKGKIFDLIVDNTTFLSFVLGLIYWKLVDGFLGSFYIVVFLAVIFFGLQTHDLKNDGALMSKSRYFVLLAFLFLTIFNFNFLDHVLIFCGVYLFIHCVFFVKSYFSKL